MNFGNYIQVHINTRRQGLAHLQHPQISLDPHAVYLQPQGTTDVVSVTAVSLSLEFDMSKISQSVVTWSLVSGFLCLG